MEMSNKIIMSQRTKSCGMLSHLQQNQVYPGGLSRGCGEFGPVSGSEYSPEWILPSPGRRSIQVRGRYVKV